MKNIIALFQKLYGWVFNKVDYLQSPFLLAVRLYWGWQLMQTDGARSMTSQKWLSSSPVSIFLCSSQCLHGLVPEFFGGMLLFAGLASRLIAIPIFINYDSGVPDCRQRSIHVDTL